MGEVLYESIVITGAILSIQVTVAVASPVFPARSINSNVNVHVSVNVWVNQSVLVIVIGSDQLKVAITSPLVAVHEVGEYVRDAVGLIVS